ncbi:MAG: PAS domain-containing sensor histidine kinase [Planctomycetota bacterium]
MNNLKKTKSVTHRKSTMHYLGEPPVELWAIFQSPFSLLIIIACSVFVSEALVMFILHYLQISSTWFRALLDSTFLLFFIFPLLYIFLFRPLSLHIIERKKAEVALSESEKKYRTLFEQAGDSIVIIDPETRGLLEFNDMAHESLGYTREEFEKIKISDFEFYENEQEVKKRAKKVLMKELDTFEAKHRTKSGEIRDLHISNKAVTIYGGTFLLSIWRDITDIKKIQKALRDSQERFRELAELLPETVFEMDANGYLTFVNHKTFDHFGYTQQDFNRGLNCFDMIAPDDRQRAMENAKKILNGESIELNECTALKKDGSTFPAMIHSSPIYRKGKPAGLRGFLIDITARKRLEAHLQQTHKMDAIGTLTGGIAHNFNNILGIIMGNMELVLDDVPEWNPAHFNLEEIKTASLRAKDIVRQLLGFARTTASERKPIKLIAVIKDSLKFLRTTIPRSIDILQNMHPIADTVLADPTQIHQVMINLGTNAAQAMQKTGGILKIEIQNVVLDRKSAALYPDLKMGNYLQMTVSDTGPGIVPEIRNRIFDPYFTTKEVGKGTGMGLAVVYGIVKSHGGAISVDSKVGKGATFNILFPVAVKETVTTSEIAKA